MGKKDEKIVKHFIIEKEEENVLDRNIEHRPFQIRGTANSGMKDRWNEIMPKDCWNLENFQKNPILLYQHDHSLPIGRVTEMYPTETGLKFVAVIGKEGIPLTQQQKDVVTLIEQDVIKTFSVGFLCHDYDYDKTTDVVIYKDAELLEISLVSVPMEANALLEGYGYKNFHSKKKEQKMDEEMKKEFVEIKNGLQAMQASFAKSELEIKEIREVLKKNEDLEALKKENEKLKEENQKLEEACEQLSEIVGV